MYTHTASYAGFKREHTGYSFDLSKIRAILPLHKYSSLPLCFRHVFHSMHFLHILPPAPLLSIFFLFSAYSYDLTLSPFLSLSPPLPLALSFSLSPSPCVSLSLSPSLSPTLSLWCSPLHIPSGGQRYTQWVDQTAVVVADYFGGPCVVKAADLINYNVVRGHKPLTGQLRLVPLRPLLETQWSSDTK